MSRRFVSVIVAMSGVAVVPAFAQSSTPFNTGAGIGWAPAGGAGLPRTCHDTGSCNSGMSGNAGGPTQFMVCDAAGFDDLSERIIYILGAANACQLYSREAYDEFVRQTPVEQHYAVNYTRAAIGKPLLSAAEAQAIEASGFAEASRLPGAPPMPGGAQPALAPVAGPGAVAQAAPESSNGACGFSLSRANAASQDGMAGVEGGCEWLEKNTR